MTPHRPAHRTAFTLIELLVVIVIIALLASLLLPALSRAKSRAQGVVCIGRLRQLALATQSYLGDHGVYPGAFSKDGLWTRALATYVEEHGFAPVKKNFDANQLTSAASVFRCPRRRNHTATLGINASAFGLYSKLKSSAGVPSIAGPVTETDVLAPTEMIAFGDAATAHGSQNAVLLISGGISRGRLFALPPDPQREWFRIAARVHQGHLNVVFCDGHTESLRIETLFFDTSDAALRRWNRDNEPHRE